jgi:hypothetical protein
MFEVVIWMGNGKHETGFQKSVSVGVPRNLSSVLLSLDHLSTSIKAEREMCEFGLTGILYIHHKFERTFNEIVLFFLPFLHS